MITLATVYTLAAGERRVVSSRWPFSHETVVVIGLELTVQPVARRLLHEVKLQFFRSATEEQPIGPIWRGSDFLSWDDGGGWWIPKRTPNGSRSGWVKVGTRAPAGFMYMYQEWRFPGCSSVTLAIENRTHTPIEVVRCSLRP